MNTSSEPPFPPFLEFLDENQRRLLREYEELLRETNRRINLVSRRDVEHLRTRHLLHALAIAVRPFPPGSEVVDFGTGGGLPGVPLAIAFPKVRVHLVDATRKKIFAVRKMVRRLGIENVATRHGRAESFPGPVTHAVSRATADVDVLWGWYDRVRRVPEGRSTARDDAWPPSLLALKGGDLSDEFDRLRSDHPDLEVETLALSDHFEAPFYRTKKLVRVARPDRLRSPDRT